MTDQDFERKEKARLDAMFDAQFADEPTSDVEYADEPNQIKGKKYMTPKEINDLKKEHNKLQDQGREIYAKAMELHEKCLAIQQQLIDAEGSDYDPIPLIFGSGFWIDPDL